MPTDSVPADRFFYVPLDVLTAPHDGRALVGRWWAVHPDGAAFYFTRGMTEPSPQCNEHKSITERLGRGTIPVKVPVAYIPHNWRKVWGRP